MSEFEKDVLARSRWLNGDFRSDEQRRADQDSLFIMTPEMAEAILDSIDREPGGFVRGSSMTECEGTIITREIMAVKLGRLSRRR